MVRGAPGAVVYTNSLVSDIPGIAASIVPYYSDDSTPAEVQCTGDAFQYGASGSTVNQSVPNTDPTMGAAATFASTRHDDVPRTGHDGRAPPRRSAREPPRR